MRLFSNMLTFNRIKDGEDGKPGPSLIYAGAWREDITYIKDDVVNHYVHQVRNGKKEFYLLKKPKSLGDDPYLNNTQGSGDIWRRVEQHDLILARKIQADEIDVDNLIGKKLQTEVNGPRIEAIGSELKVYGFSEHPNIILGIDKDGYSVFKYLNNDGEEMYNLGPNGIVWGLIKPSSFTKVRFYKLSAYKDKKSLTYFDVSAIKNAIDDWATDFYRYFAGSNPTIKPEDREPEKYIYKVPKLTSIRIDDGIYCTPPISTDKNSQYYAGNTGELIQPGGSSSLYQFTTGVYNKAPIYVAVIYAYRGGMLAYSQKVYWNGGMTDPIQP